MHNNLVIVESDAGDREMITFAASQMKQGGRTIFFFNSWQEARNCMGDERRTEAALVFPSVIVIAITMPEAEELKLLEWLRSDYAFNKAPVMILTRLFRERDRERAEALGVEGFFEKPMRVEDWAAIIQRLAAWPPRSR